jgi:hypothetical protein
MPQILSTIQSPGFSVYKAPQLPTKEVGVSVFLAGSIDMGKASEWQVYLTSTFSDLPITVFNPRHDDWSLKWEQDISNSKFKEQVMWEMDRLNEVDVIALYFEPGTTSPISLLQLGKYASSGKLVVCCPEGFWKRGNVQVICELDGVPLMKTMEELEVHTRKRLEEAIEKLPVPS